MSPDTAKQQKSTLRERLLAVRANLSPTFQRDSAEQAARSLLAQPVWEDAQHIGLYSAIKHELDCSPIACAAWDCGKTVYLPCVRNTRLEFRPWSRDDDLTLGAYRIPEPSEASGVTDALDLLITPLLGWSISGYRLGMGAGYYDRLLADQQTKIGGVFGLGYQCQRADEIDDCLEPWDRQLDGILTEAGFYWPDSLR